MTSGDASTANSGDTAQAAPPDKSGFWLAVLALIVSVGTGIFTYLQYRVADRARQELHDDSMQVLKISYRPYVSAQGALQVTQRSSGRVAEVGLEFTAKGSSPALDVVVEKHCQASNEANQNENRGLTAPPEAWTKLSAAKAHAVLFPDTKVAFHCNAYVADDSVFIFAVGVVTYKDIFKETHKTTFCFENAPREQLIEMLPCGAGNSMT